MTDALGGFCALSPHVSGQLKRLVIMSATIDLQFFISYFEKLAITPEVISIEGRTGTVDRFFLNDIYAIPECQKYIDGT